MRPVRDQIEAELKAEKETPECNHRRINEEIQTRREPGDEEQDDAIAEARKRLEAAGSTEGLCPE